MSKMELIEIETKALELETKKFELEQRRAKALSASAFFPRELKSDIASAVIIYDLAHRMDISVMEVAQNIYIIHGKPSFSTAFLVARLMQSGLIKGTLKTVVSDDKQSAYCKAIDAETGEEVVGMTVTMEMARAEGWLGKNGSKWKTMPELMLRKRAQAFFIREYYPQVMFGMQSAEEVDDVTGAGPSAIDTEIVGNDLNAALSKKQPTKEKVVEVAPEPEQVQQPEPADHPDESEAEKPAKPRRMPLKVSKHYPKLIDAGIKQRDLKEFAVRVGLPEMEEQAIIDWFTNENIEAWAAWFYGNGEHPHDLNGNITPAEEAVEAEIEEPMTVAEQEAEEVFAPKPQPQPEPAPTAQQTPASATQLQRAATGDGVSAAVAQHYGLFIGMGLPEEDCKAFVEWAGLKADNIDEFIADPGGVADLIETFKMEAGYA